MLYDNKRWDVFSKEKFISWLASKPRKQYYGYQSNKSCLISDYLREACGWEQPWVSIVYVEDSAVLFSQRTLPEFWDTIAATIPHTYGAALKRARYFLEDA